MVDDAQNTVRFPRVECGGFLELGATHVMIPEALHNERKEQQK